MAERAAAPGRAAGSRWLPDCRADAALLRRAMRAVVIAGGAVPVVRGTTPPVLNIGARFPPNKSWRPHLFWLHADEPPMAQLRERSDKLHEILTQHAQQLLLPRGLAPESRDRLFKATLWMRDQPERRAEYFKGMMGAWMMLQVAVIVTMGIPAAVAVAFDPGALRAVASVAAGLEAFCIAGVSLAAWWYYAARWAAREADVEDRKVPNIPEPCSVRPPAVRP